MGGVPDHFDVAREVVAACRGQWDASPWNLRSQHPVPIDGGFGDLEVPIPSWDGRTLRYRFPPR
jgi:hypothetical protein